MALASVNNLHTTKHRDLDANATAVQVGSGAKTVFAVEVDNAANTVDVWFKMYSTSPTVGTSDPMISIKILAGTKRKQPFNNGTGVAIATSLFVACVTAKGTAGSTGPTNDVKASIWTD